MMTHLKRAVSSCVAQTFPHVHLKCDLSSEIAYCSSGNSKDVSVAAGAGIRSLVE
jgi:hypothetical protein